MLTMNIEATVDAIVRNLLSTGREDEGLHFAFQVRASDDKYHRASLRLHLVYHKREGHVSISVFSALVTDGHTVFDLDASRWTHEVTHDSCWADINVCHRAVMQLTDSINAQREKDGFEPVAAIDLEFFTRPYTFKLFEWLPVVVSRDPNDPHRYRRTLQVRPLQPQPQDALTD